MKGIWSTGPESYYKTVRARAVADQPISDRKTDPETMWTKSVTEVAVWVNMMIR